jgi:murein DD-endopeptidase MepM/ murein hydrolase activator NlpD
MTDNELEALFAKLRAGIDLTNEEMIALARNSGYMSGQFKRLEVSVDSFAKDLKKAGDELPSALLKSAGNTVKSLGGLAKGLGEAETGFRQLTPIIDAAAAAFSTVPVIGGMVKAAAEAGKFMINQLQNATDAFHEISKVGGLTAQGMTGLQQQFLESGMQLKSYTKTIAANSAALSNFAGSVGEGAEKFSRTAGMVQKQFGQGLQRLGYGIDEIGETTASYIARQTRMGLSQGKSNEMLAAGAARYAIELDELSKLTGASKDELKKQQDAALSESRFRGKIEEMRMNGQGEQAEKLIAAQSALAKQSPALGRAFRDSVSGFIGTSKESIAGYQSLGGEMAGLVDTAMTGSISDVTNFSKDAMKRMMPMFAQLAQMGVDIGIPFSEMADAANGVTKSSKDLQDVQGKQINAPDKLTEQTVSAQRNMQELSIQIQKLGFTYMPAAASAVNTFTGALNKLLKTVSKEVGGPDVTINGTNGTSTSPNQTAASKRRATMDRRRQEAEDAALAGQTPAQQAASNQTAANAPLSATPDLGSGPAFGRPDTTRADKVQLTLDEIRDEIKKLVAVGGISTSASSGPQAAQTALAEHDHAHPHGETGSAVSPEIAKQIAAGFVNPLEKMNQTSGMIRNDGKTYHGGIDLGGKIGDKIMAPITGKITRVLEAGKGDGGFGNAVEIEDAATGMKHMLAHMDKSMAKVGDVVKAGTQVGTLGNTGQSTGPHLHHEIKDRAGNRIDPSQFYAGAAGNRGRATASAGAPGGATDMATYMKTVAMLESGGNPNAKAGSSNGNYSSAGGLFQFLESSYEGVTGRKGSGAERFDPAKSTEAMQKLTMMNKGQMEKGLGRGVSGEDLYMGHFLGAGGATKFLKAKDQDPNQSAAKFDPTAAGSNKSIYYDQKNNNRERSIAEVHSLMTEKYRKQQAAIQAGQKLPDVVAGLTGTGTLAAGTSSAPTALTLATPTAPVARPAYASATAGLAGQGQDIISSGLQAVTTALFGGGAQGAPGSADSGVGGSEVVTLLSQLVALSRDQNSNLGKILSASTA